MYLCGGEHLAHVSRGNRRLALCIQTASLIQDIRESRIRAGAQAPMTYDHSDGRHSHQFPAMATRPAGGR